MVKQRLLTALVLLPIIVIIWFGSPAYPLGRVVYSLTVAAAATLGAVEFFGMKGLSWRHPLTLLGVVWVLLFVLSAHFDVTYALLLLTAGVVVSLVAVLLLSPVREGAGNWAWVLTGAIYVGWMLSYFIPLRGLEGGRDWVFVALLTTVAVDTTAFFVGRAWGRHALAPRVSPSKTWEGTIGGFLAAIAACLILAAVLPSVAVGWEVAVLGVLIGVFAQVGDLAESMLKRGAGVKDASRLMPGHGGLLDRLDSIIFTVVVVYYYVLWVVV